MQAPEDICTSLLRHPVDWTYELELVEAYKIHPIFYMSLLHPFWVSMWTLSQGSAIEDLELEEEDCSYENEKLLRWSWTGHSGRRRKREFLIMWKHYFIDDASWIPESNFDYPTEIP